MNQAVQRRRRESSQGMVLVVVLWVLLALSLLALSFAVAIRTEVEAARNVVEQKQAFYLARAGIEYAVFKIIESESAFAEAQLQRQQGGSAVSQVLTGDLSLELAGGTVDIRIDDESGKIDLNSAGENLIFNLLVMIGLGDDVALPLTSAIVDWRDPDDFPSPGGAESSYYQSLETPYYAKNGAFDVPEELLLVRGVTPEIYYGRKGLTADLERADLYGLQKYFTTFATTGSRINVGSAPVQVLAAIPDLSFDDAMRIVEMRESGEPLEDLADIMRQIPGLPTSVLQNMTLLRSNVFSIDAVGRPVEGGSSSRIRAVISINPASRKGYSILYWNESNIEL